MFNKDRRRILILLSGLISLSLVMIIYITYFEIFQAEAVKKHPANRRSLITENEVLRGSIYDRNGELLAYSEGTPGKYVRHYNYPEVYSHIIGYSNNALGKSGLELMFNDYLLNRNGNKTLNSIKNLLNKEEKVGNNLVLTIDTAIQERARELLREGNKKGAIVLMNPKNGEIYAMVSLPDFNSETIVKDWESINAKRDGPLVNRATDGLYPPGSTFKIVTAAALLENPSIDQSYVDTGVQTIDGKDFKNAKPDEENGKVNLKTAFAESLNTYFVSKGVDLGQSNLRAEAEKFMFERKIDFDLPVKRSKFDQGKKLPLATLASSAMGQGNVESTPLNMALVASTIANDGKMVKPILVKEIESKSGSTIRKAETEIMSEVLSPEVSNTIKDMMIDVVNKGSGTNAYIKGIQVAGKTGTAENATGKNHAWFVGFMPAKDPKLAVAVVLQEEDDWGGTAAAPIARDLLIYANRNLNISNLD